MSEKGIIKSWKEGGVLMGAEEFLKKFFPDGVYDRNKDPVYLWEKELERMVKERAHE